MAGFAKCIDRFRTRPESSESGTSHARMVVAVLGGSGQLGQALKHVAGDADDFTWHFASSSEADITHPDSIATFFDRVKPDFCINAAAYTAVDKAESEPEKAHLINVTAVENVARACADRRIKLIHISTDFVCDGNHNQPYKEDDQPNPQGVYGQTKWEGEKALQSILPEHFIVRTAWVYSEFGHNFMKTML